MRSLLQRQLGLADRVQNGIAGMGWVEPSRSDCLSRLISVYGLCEALG